MTWTLIITIWTGGGVGYLPTVSTGYASQAACDRAGEMARAEVRRRDEVGWIRRGMEWKCVEAGR